MPNNIKTIIKFKNLKSKDDIDFILDMIATPQLTLPDGKVIEWSIDFNKIIPEPDDEVSCPDEFKMNKDSHVEKLPDKPWFNWYDWHIKYWGTKWNAYDCYTKIGKSYIMFIFSTAWAVAYPIVKRLAVLGYDMEIRYADEDLGFNCGKIYYTNEWTEIPATLMKNPYRYALNLWDNY